MNPYQVVKRPLITEKTTRSKEVSNWYAFEVDRRANKIQIRQAIEKIFGVKVLEINTTTLPGKTKRFGAHLSAKKSWKKAVAKLKEGDRIELYEGA